MRFATPKQLLWMGLIFVTSISGAGFTYASASGSTSSTILVVGDSLSAAYNIPRESGWVSLLRDQLQKVAPGATVVNGSVSGATTAAGLEVLPEYLHEHKPNLVILELGANDGLQGKPINYIRANLTRLIQLSLDADAQVILVGVRLPPNYGIHYTEPFFNQYAQLAHTYELGYVPFILDGVAGNDGLMQEDGLHPVAEAQPLILDNVWPAVAAILKGVSGG